MPGLVLPRKREGQKWLDPRGFWNDSQTRGRSPAHAVGLLKQGEPCSGVWGCDGKRGWSPGNSGKGEFWLWRKR